MIAALLVGVLACSGGATDTADPCAEAPVVTWETFGEGFLRENCQGCHASSVVDRAGAPVDVTFDDRSAACEVTCASEAYAVVVVAVPAGTSVTTCARVAESCGS